MRYPTVEELVRYPTKEYVQTAKMSGYGLSTEQITDILERDGRTIWEWQKALGQKRQLWLFITLEAQTKFWVNFELGSRTSHLYRIRQS